MQKVSKEHLEMFEGHTLLKPDQVGFFPANHCFLRNVLPNLSDIACQNIFLTFEASIVQLDNYRKEALFTRMNFVFCLS
jgi:hypothetical protein